MLEENVLSSWLREDGREKEERTVGMGSEKKEERGEKRRREGEEKENETGTVKRGSDGFVSVEGFEILSQRGDLESCGGLSWNTFWISLRTCLIVSLRLGVCAGGA